MRERNSLNFDAWFDAVKNCVANADATTLNKLLQNKKYNKQLSLEYLYSLRDDFGDLHYIKKTICEKSLYDFVKYFWNVVEANEFIDNWHIEAICKHLEAGLRGELRYLLVNIAPGLAKSLIISVLFPVWCWINDPRIKTLSCSNNNDLAVRDTGRSRDLILSEEFQKFWRKEVALQKDNRGKSVFATTKLGVRKAMSSQGRITGFRCNHLIFDDPNDINFLKTGTSIGDVNLWISRLLSRVNQSDKIQPFVVVVMQRLCFGDASDFFHNISKKAGSDKYAHLFLPAEYDPERHCATKYFSDPRTSRGELLCEKILSREVLEEMRSAFGLADYNAQYQQLTVFDNGDMVKTEWWKYYEASELPTMDFILHSADTAWEEKKSSDYTVITTWGVAQNNIYLLDIYRAQIAYPELKRQVVTIYEKFDRKAMTFLIEKAASGIPIVQELTETISVPFEAVQPLGSKEVRMKAATPLIESGRVFLPKNHPYLADFLLEFSIFPKAKIGIHDDCVDSTSQALNAIRGYVSSSNSVSVF